MKLPARDPMLQLPARLTFGLADQLMSCLRALYAGCVALAHGALHLCDQLCKVMMVVSKCRLVGHLAGDLVLSLGLRARVGQ